MSTSPGSIALCLHFSLEHYRGGEKWTASIANRLADDGFSVDVRALPYAPGNVRRVSARSVLDSRIRYEEAWSHDLTTTDYAYLVYAPGMRQFFRGADEAIAGIHSWAFVSQSLVEPHYSTLHNASKVLFRLIGAYDLRRFDRVHTVTPVFSATDHIDAVYIPNFVDRSRFHPSRAQRFDEFTVLVTAASVPEKGWDLACRTAELLSPNVRFLATGPAPSPSFESLGYLTEDRLADVYSKSHVVLHPARVDTDSMVINEACASGTPVVTTPLETHVRQNEAIIHASTPLEMAFHIERLHGEWATSAPYERRCRVARQTSESRDADVVYPMLRDLILGVIEPPEDAIAVNEPSPGTTIPTTR